MRRRPVTSHVSCSGAIITFFVQLLFSPVYAAQALSINAPTDPPLTTPAKDGLLDIVVGEAFRRNGLALELVKLPAERALQNANNGIDDGDLSRIAGLEQHYPNLIRVPEKLFDMDFVVFTNSPKVTASDLETIARYNVGLIRGWKILETKTAGMPYVTAVRNAETLFNMLSKKRIEIALYSRWMGTALSKKLGIANVRVIDPPLASKEMFMYLNKKHKDLIPRLAESLRQIKQEGMYEKIFSEKLKALHLD